MRKVIHVITSLGQGGAESMLEKLVTAGTRLDPNVEHEVVSLQDLGDVGARIAAAGIPVQALGLGPTWNGMRGFVRLVTKLSAAPADTIVQTWMYHADLIGGIAARLARRRRVVWNVRQTGLNREDIGAATRRIVRLCAVFSRLVPECIVTNARAAVPGHEALGYSSRRWVVIPNGFDTDQYTRDLVARQALRQQWRLSDEDVAIGMVARLDPQKDHAGFVAMAALVAARVPRLKFVLAGRNIPDDPRLLRLIDEAGLKDRFVLVEQRRDVSAVMSALDVFCLSSRAEGFPNVLGEAMSCETPCVTTNAGDAAYVLGDERFVAPVSDSPALAACVLRVAELDPVARAALGSEQRKRVLTHFGIEKVWREYRDLYRSL